MGGSGAVPFLPHLSLQSLLPTDPCANRVHQWPRPPGSTLKACDPHSRARCQVAPTQPEPGGPLSTLHVHAPPYAPGGTSRWAPLLAGRPPLVSPCHPPCP